MPGRTMKWGSALSRTEPAGRAFAEAAEAVERQLGGSPASLVVLFASPHHSDSFQRVASLAAERFPRAVVAGCSGSASSAARGRPSGDRGSRSRRGRFRRRSSPGSTWT